MVLWALSAVVAAVAAAAAVAVVDTCWFVIGSGLGLAFGNPQKLACLYHCSGTESLTVQNTDAGPGSGIGIPGDSCQVKQQREMRSFSVVAGLILDVVVMWKKYHEFHSLQRKCGVVYSPSKRTVW